MRTTAKVTLETLVPRDIMSALESLGIDAEQSGDEAKALCPNPEHNDRHPSWSCNLEDGRHNCFACGFGGSFVYLVTKMLGMPTPDASQWVRERKGKDVAAGYTGPRVRDIRQIMVLSEADLWRFTDPPAEALESRGLTAEACREYDVRWDADYGYWVTTVRDPYSGQLWGWQEKNDRHFLNHPKDLTKSKALFGYSLVPDGGAAVLVESPLDVPYIRSRYGGPGHPVSSYGASVSRDQVSLLRDRCGLVVLAMDNDEAGWRSVAKLSFAFHTTAVRVFDYGNLIQRRDGVFEVGEMDGRDPGNLTADEIAWGIQHAVSVWRLRFP